MTNNQLTKEWLQQTIAELESVRDEIPFGIDTNSELELAAFKLALSAMDSEPVVWTDEEELRDANQSGSGYLFGIGHDANKFADPRRQIMLYRHAQPAPVVPEEMPSNLRGLIEAHTDRLFDDDDAQEIWNACRAAMLQAEPVTTANKLGNSPVIPDGWKLVPVEPNGDMLAAAQDAYGETDGDIASTLRAAIAAAQPAPTIQVTDAMAFAFHHALTDGPLGDEDVEDIKAGLRSAFANATANQPTLVLPDDYQNLSELYHALEKRLFKIAQRIKGTSFDKYAHTPSQAIDVLEESLFGEDDITRRATMLAVLPPAPKSTVK